MNLKTKLIMVVVLLVNMQLFAQEFTVTGVVADANNVPITGASVLVTNTTRGVLTDFDGKYSIEVSSGESLSFSYVGFATQSIAITDQSTVNVVLKQDLSELDEVVVVGYGSLKKSDLTGSVSSVKTEEITAFPVLDAAQALQGRTAGVNVQSNNGGEPGAPIAINIRGTGSINANSDPLIVVDGFVGAAFPQPNDIASIEVLKDASSTAIYGSQGSGGVVLITTKKGTKGKLSVEFNSNISVQNTLNSLDLLNASEFADYQNQIRANQGSTVPYVQGDADTDWQDLIYRGGYVSNQQLSFSGGSDKINFYASINYFDQEGIVVNSDFQRATFLANVDAQVNDKLKMGANLFGSTSEQNAVATQSDGSVTVGSDDAISLAFRFAPDKGIFNEDGTFSTNDAIGDEVDNPFAVATQRDDVTNEENFRANWFGEYQLSKNLTFKSTLGLSTRNITNGRYQPSTLTITSGGVDGRAFISSSRRESVLTESYLTYKNEWGKANLTLLGGYSFQRTTNEAFSTEATGFITDSFSFRNIDSASNFLQPQSSFTTADIESQFGRATFDWDDRYLITGTIRRDVASVFAVNNQEAYFPSAAIAWKISNESFLENNTTLSNLKIRASYGEVGNPNIAAFSSSATLEPIFSNVGGETVNAVTLGRPSNPDLRWESSLQTNIGIDVGLFNNRVSLTADYYNIDTEDVILINQTILDFSGFDDDAILTNSGELNNSGLELAFNTVNVDNGKFRWNSGFNISFPKSEVIALDGGLDIFETGAPSYFSTDDDVIVREGEEIGLFWGFDYQGVFQGGTLPAGTAAFADAVPGDPLFTDANGDGTISNDDRTIIGNPNPDFFFGFTNTFTYKNIDLNIFLQGTSGNDIFNLNDVQLNNGDANTTRDYFNDAWTPTNTGTNQPRVGNNSNREISSRFVEDGSYIRLKNVALGYTFPTDMAKLLKMESIRVAVSGQNLWTITDYSGLDPEVNFNAGNTDNRTSNTVRGFDFGNFPTVRSITFNVNLKF